MKECPECSMFNADSAVKCKFCGAHMGSGASPGPSDVAAKREDPRKKEEREREDRKKKIITYVGYGVVGAALVGWLIYTYVKKSKEPPPEEATSGEVAGPETPDEPEIEGEEEAEKKEAKAPPLGDPVTLDDVGLTFRPFENAVIEGAGDAAEPDPSMIFKASTDDGVVALTVTRSENTEGASPPSGATSARIEADYILSKGRPVVIPGKKKGKSKAGPYIMYEADLGQTMERAYYIFLEGSRVDFLFSYPAADGKVTSHEKLVHNIMASVKPLEEPPVEPPVEEKPAKAPKPEPEPKKPAPEKKPEEKKEGKAP